MNALTRCTVVPVSKITLVLLLAVTASVSPLSAAELSVSPIFSEQIDDSAGTSSFSPDIEPVVGDPNQRVLLATSVSDYPVTPGDVYRITYIRLSDVISTEAIVNNDKSMNLNIFGIIKADDLSYPQLRAKIEKLIAAAYPDSRPQVTLQSTGIFRVLVMGEVASAGFVQAWGLSRVSQVVKGKMTRYSSVRTVSLVSKSGKSKTCDLFLASRNGLMDRDPMVSPDDTIVVSRAERRVSISGSVYRPGTYELLGGEQLDTLISKYSEGMLETGDAREIFVRRRIGTEKTPGEIIRIDALDAGYGDFPLVNTDEVFVSSKVDKSPVVYFEGALNLSSPDNDPLVKVNGRLGYRFIPGETLSRAVASVRKSFSELALLDRAYVIRESENKPIPVDIEALLSDSPQAKDIALVPGDRIVIPMRQFFVTVGGAVLVPGRYPYLPDRNYQFYLSCAGGVDPQKNTDSSVIIKDSFDKTQALDRPIQPEDSIYAEFNNPAYYIGQWLPVIELSVSVAALVIAIAQLLD